MWRVNEAIETDDNSFEFSTNHSYLTAGRKPEVFLELVKEVIDCIEGEMH